MNKRANLLALLSFGLLGIGSVSADPLLIHEISLDVRGSNYIPAHGDTPLDLYNQFLLGSDVGCNDVSLDAVDAVGSVQTCGGPNRNIATLIEIELDTNQFTRWQLGPDWGRGGAILAFRDGTYLAGAGPYLEDLWWAMSWTNVDEIIDFGLAGGLSNLTLAFLGFEGCCGGATSARYSADGGETWTIAAVNAVPEPGTLALFGLGLLGLGLSRRTFRKAG